MIQCDVPTDLDSVFRDSVRRRLIQLGYRILGDFYPEGATPQLIAKTIFVAGSTSAPTPLMRDYSPKSGQNIKVELSTFPAQPVAGKNTQMHFTITPAA